MSAATLLGRPVWQLTASELDLLDPQERQWAVSQAAYLRETGTVALLVANPPGTTYRTVWDGHLGWKLEPFCQCADLSYVTDLGYPKVSAHD